MGTGRFVLNLWNGFDVVECWPELKRIEFVVFGFVLFAMLIGLPVVSVLCCFALFFFGEIDCCGVK